ncbi:S9 family peptidase [Flavobacterium defluvii]|uniref:Dipeptidyl aminopeptidase/acylaminoacyl peptidase n=1 Tax=Flavobacterium defluvii TaxID=370979 RepID=A0A1M5JCJ7_9FLAO|nr:prolyl oligopeptidase family serine peptidase [Flavobacterium defluvii]SHG38288.1 Dipeptidyl aminopeptidase/acylaminoacyl peptidase [Flavobacterium defluvii]
MFLFNLIIRKISFFILQLVVCLSWGQTMQKKRLLTPDFYHLWSTLQLDKISENGEWISWKMSYSNGNDTLFLKNPLHNKILQFSFGTNSIFAGNDFFICQIGKNLELLNLKSYKKEFYPNIDKFEYSAPIHTLVFLKKKSELNNSLVIRSFNNGSVKEIQNVINFTISPCKRYITYSLSQSKNLCSVHIYDLRSQIDLKLAESEADTIFSDFTWQNDGNAIAFLQRSYNQKIISIYFFILKDKKMKKLEEKQASDSLYGKSFYWDPFYKIIISDDLKRVFFSVRDNKSNKNNTSSLVEIWNGNDKWIYPQDDKTGNFKDSPKIALWEPEKNICRQITSDSLPKILLTGNFNYALLYNPKDYEPQFEDEGPSDIYLMDLNTLEKSLLLKKQFGCRRSVIPSPNGKFIAYYKNNHWWIYDLYLKSHHNVTEKVGVSFTEKTRLSAESLCGSPGWSKDGKNFIIYDQYDIWIVKTDGSSFKKITSGRDAKIVFRITESSATKILNYQYDKSKNQIYDLEKPLILQAHGEDEKTGYFQWFPNNKVKKIIYEASLIKDLKSNFKGESIVFLEQKFNMPPKLQLVNGNKKKSTVYSSNNHHEKFLLGNSKLIYYQNSKKQNIKSVLIYPANYNHSKKYPMIVNIYEIQSMNLHKYFNPTLFNEGGFNPSILSSEGYFVLLPDIILEQGNPGISALDCVTSATQKIIDMGLVDPASIGLMGHSFGGFETAFIATQTNLFAAVVPSGAITNLKNFYFTVNLKSGKPESWRFQSLQWNMRKSPFEEPDLYVRNSPIDHIEKIKVPTLLWSGKEDAQVDVKQSIEFYLALRRLGKKSIMLLYPNENHSFSSESAQKDISIRILQWFDYFLKKKQGKEYLWISDGIK